MAEAGSEDDTYLLQVLHWLETANKSSREDFTKPYVRPSLRYVYPLFVLLYSTVGALGVCGNVAVVAVTARRRLLHDHTSLLLTNVALSNLVTCLCSLPATLANLLIQNWLFGSFLCFFLPMLQTCPVYVSFLTFLIIAIDRYRLILHPFRSRVPVGLGVVAVWVVSLCSVLPYVIYIKYVDLGATLGARFASVGMCYVAMQDRIEEYIRALFVTLYVMPLAVIALLYVRISAELKSREATPMSIHFTSARGSHGSSASAAAATATSELAEHALQAGGCRRAPGNGVNNSHSDETVAAPSSPADDASALSTSQQHRHRQCCHQHRSRLCTLASNSRADGKRERSGFREDQVSQDHDAAEAMNPDPCSAAIRITPDVTQAGRDRSPTQDLDDDLDLVKEKRTQNYLITMTTVLAMCWCPINILILVAYFVHENNNNEESYDITYITFTWFAYLSTCTTPVLFASWRMSSATKDRLRGYFSFSSRRFHGQATQRRWRRTSHYISGSCISLDSHVIMDRHSISSEGCPV